MNKSTTRRPRLISENLLKVVREQLSQNKRLRRSLPILGRLHIDRQLPFLCVYRQPPDQQDLGTERLVMGEASYLIAAGDKKLRDGVSALVRQVAETMTEAFGAFLIVELWAAQDSAEEVDDKPLPVRRPHFRIFARKSRTPPQVVAVLKQALETIRIRKARATVEVVYGGKKTGPPGLPVLLDITDARALSSHVIGLEVRPIYRSQETGEVFPEVRRTLLRLLSRALQRTFFEYARKHTSQRPAHYHALGRRAVVQAVWEVDRRLAEVSNEFDFLLQVTPMNSTSAWNQFRRRHFERAPVFYYRPLAADPSLLRRRLWDIPIERLEDPTLGQLFREKRLELDTQIAMLDSIDTPRFLLSSQQLYGHVDDKLLLLAEDILNTVSPHSHEEGRRKDRLNAKAFAERAREELAYYREQHPGMRSGVQIRKDVAGLMVSRGKLLISDSTLLTPSRAEALLQHEVGTHIVTYFNGRAQPFRQLYAGLAGYDELQEGLAVFAEYLAGDLSRPRLRLLAARVLAARRLEEGAELIEVFRELNQVREFAQRTAFIITMRVFRGGGLTKDMVYLRGLVSLMAYLKKGGELTPLFVGKIGADHIPVVRELQLRKVLQKAPLQPRYMELPTTAERLANARNGLSVHQLTERE